MPQPGDLAMFAWHGTSRTDNYLSHTAIVSDVSTNGKTVIVTVIDGNSSGQVRRNEFCANITDGNVGKGHLVYFISLD